MGKWVVYGICFTQIQGTSEGGQHAAAQQRHGLGISCLGPFLETCWAGHLERRGCGWYQPIICRCIYIYTNICICTYVYMDIDILICMYTHTYIIFDKEKVQLLGCYKNIIYIYMCIFINTYNALFPHIE